jgi:hypothetical protein
MIAGRKLSDIWPHETVNLIMGEMRERGFTSSNAIHGFTFPFSTSDYEARLSLISETEAWTT